MGNEHIETKIENGNIFQKCNGCGEWSLLGMDSAYVKYEAKRFVEKHRKCKNRIYLEN